MKNVKSTPSPRTERAFFFYLPGSYKALIPKLFKAGHMRIGELVTFFEDPRCTSMAIFGAVQAVIEPDVLAPRQPRAATLVVGLTVAFD